MSTFIKVRALKNVFLAHFPTLSPPHSFTTKMIDGIGEVFLDSFDLSVVHTVPLLPEDVEKINEPGINPALKKALQDENVQHARDNRTRNRLVREKIAQHVANGDLEIVDKDTPSNHTVQFMSSQWDGTPLRAGDSR